MRRWKLWAGGAVALTAAFTATLVATGVGSANAQVNRTYYGHTDRASYYSIDNGDTTTQYGNNSCPIWFSIDEERYQGGKTQWIDVRRTNGYACGDMRVEYAGVSDVETKTQLQFGGDVLMAVPLKDVRYYYVYIDIIVCDRGVGLPSNPYQTPPGGCWRHKFWLNS